MHSEQELKYFPFFLYQLAFRQEDLLCSRLHLSPGAAGIIFNLRMKMAVVKIFPIFQSDKNECYAE